MNYVYLISSHSKTARIVKNDVGLVKSNEQGNLLVYFLRENLEINTDRSEVSFFDVSKTGDEYDYKICDRCFKHLSTNIEFQNNRHKKGDKITKRPSCKECRKNKDGKSISATERSKFNESKPKDYEPFTCPICDKTTIAGISKVVLDHCHKTGRARGWICESCNTGIGRFDDDPKVVHRAIEWLERDI